MKHARRYAVLFVLACLTACNHAALVPGSADMSCSPTGGGCCEPSDCHCAGPYVGNDDVCKANGYSTRYYCQKYPMQPTTQPANWPAAGCKFVQYDDTTMAWHVCCP